MDRYSSRFTNIVLVGILVVSTFSALAGVWFMPTAYADAGADLEVDVNIPVDVDGTGSHGVGALEYTWFFRDGTQTTVRNPITTHTYSEEGVYEVGLLVEDTKGYFDFDTVQITVKNYFPVADAGLDMIVYEDEVVEFNGSGSSDVNNDIVSYEWDLDDGSLASGLTTWKSYENAGTYHVTLTVLDNDGAYDKDTITVTVLNKIPTAEGLANNELDDELTVYEDDLIDFDASQSTDTPSDAPSLEYSWDYGDGSKGCDPLTSHVYTREGTYTATLTVSDDNHALDRDTITILVLNANPSAKANQNLFVNEGTSLFFNGNGTYDTPSDQPLLKYSWDYETDGVYDDLGWYSKHTWWDDGTPQTTIKAEDDDGALDSDTQAVTVNNVAPKPSIFNYSVKEYTIADFGLRVAGEKWHDVQLWLYENGTEIAYRQVTRTPGSPNDQMAFIYNVTIHRFTTYEARIEYTPEDDPINGQLNGASPCWLILYLEDGNEFRFHRAFNYNKPDQWIWEIDLSSIVKLEFQAEMYDPGMDTLTFEWNFGDLMPTVSHTYASGGLYPTKQTDYATHIYVLSGAYTITLMGIDDDGGIRSFTLDLTNAPDAITIDNLAPRAYATVDISSALEDEYFTFSGSGIDLLNNGLSYDWNFDDGQSAIRQNVTHSYADEGVYLVTLTVSDSLGATGTDYVFVTVTNFGPVAKAGSDQTVDEDDPVYFDAFGTPGSYDTPSDLPLLTFAWDFGDKSQGYGISTYHVYTKSGLYTVSLSIQDNNGAIGWDMLTVTVNNTAPYDLLITADQFVDENEPIFFHGFALDTPTDEPMLIYEWDFGDGTIVCGRNPTHSYSSPGLFHVTLTVTDDDSSTAYTDVTISAVNVRPTVYGGATPLTLYGPAITMDFNGRGFDTYSDLSTLKFEWDLGNGVYEYTSSVSVAFSATGIYDISFWVTDEHSSVSLPVHIRINFIMDSDGDMLTDEDESGLGTNPNAWDSDGDNLLDYWEVIDYPTDPLLDDTDYDGLNDWEEITFLKLTDPDEDGLVNPLDWDSEGDMIIDGLDAHPLLYDDTDGSILTWDTINASHLIGEGVSVVMYGGSCIVKPMLSEIVPTTPLNGGIGSYVRVTSTCTPPYQAQIRIKYDQSLLPGSVHENRLGIFEWSPQLGMWKLVGETGVDTTYDFVWAKVSYFSDYIIADIGQVDSDGDGLSDWYEINTPYHGLYEHGGAAYYRYSGGVLYVKNSRTQIRIPYSVIKSNTFGYYGIVDLLGLGFTKIDFETTEVWVLNNGGYRTYISTSTPGIYNTNSALLTFELYTLTNYMRIDLEGHSDPNNPDTDGDGLNDGDELNILGSARFDRSSSSNDLYSQGRSLYIKNNRMEAQIPSGNIIWNGYWMREETYGTVDLFSLGFNEGDFANNNKWEITNGGIKEYATLFTTKIDDVVSGTLHFDFRKILPFTLKMYYYILIDAQVQDSTNPIDPDTDHDGLSDGIEINTFRTDPTDSDTDNDGYKDKYDRDPLEDLKVYVNIKEILQSVEAVELHDFYVRICINGWWWSQPPQLATLDEGHIYPNIQVSRDIPDGTQYVEIKIELWDYELNMYGDPDDQLDISRYGRTVDLTYDVKTGMWSGDDQPKYMDDKNGFGHASGNEDGSYGKRAEDSDIWFDVFQSDYDHDKLPFWQEVQVLGTNPKQPNHDSDSDGMPDWYEVRYGLNINNPSDAGGDADSDRLSNKEEHDLGTDPRFYEFNLWVSFEFNAKSSYFNLYETAMRKASDFIYDVTDGYMYFRYVVIEDKGYGWSTADIQVHSGTADSQGDHHWPKATPGGIDHDDEYITMPEKYDHDNAWGASNPSSSVYYKTIGHEFGHYGFYCRDEYEDINGKSYPYPWGPLGHNKGPAGMMNNQWDYSEMTTEKTYDKWSPPTGYETTEHWGEKGMSTWKTFFEEYVDKVFFDLNKDEVRDTTYKNSYSSYDGPEVMVDGTYTIVKTINH